MEVKVGVEGTPRDLVVDTDASADEVMEALRESVSTGGVFVLTDAKGRQIAVPAAKVAFVEMGEAAQRRVGFATA